MSRNKIQLLKISEVLSEEESLKPITTSNQELDRILGGGIPMQKITEIFGDKGIGKTALCCQLALNVQIPEELGGLASECLYIDTENTFVKRRIETMAEKCAAHCWNREPSSALTTSPFSLLDGIHLVRCGTVEELRNIFEELSLFLAHHPKVKLIVIDSLAFPFYGGTEEFNERGKVLYELSQMLFQVLKELKVGIVVTNNTTTRFSDTGFDYRVPFLGLTWTHIPNVRLELFSSHSGKTRNGRVVKGKVMDNENDSATFQITPGGITE